MATRFRPSRTAATLSAALLVGAGGGAGAALAIDGGGGTSVTHLISSTQGATETASSTTGTTTIADVYKSAKQGVVDITVSTQGGRAEGTGIVIDTRGDIVTNQHVVDGASSVEVKFADGSKA